MSSAEVSRAACFVSHDQLAGVEGLGQAVPRVALDPADPQDRLERLGSEPMFRPLRLETTKENIDLPPRGFGGQRNVQVRHSKIPFVLRYFVLEYEVVPERVPGQL